tara:strand:+ start:65 stop:427 length:363 start_codon:yes stop_codon:yes gene_type:complete
MKTTKSQRQKLLSLKKREEFLLVQNKGKKWVSETVIIQTMPNDIGPSRIGFTVSKKISKSAVTRNRIKRRLRAAAADIIGVKGKSGHDYILVGRAKSETVSYEQILKDLKWCLKRLELLA